jgi:DnaJ-class molecular chaperone
MDCNLCDGKGIIKLIRFGRESENYCYVCEGVGKIENCKNCEGIGELAIKEENGLYKFSPCLVCMGHGVIPKQEKCACEGKGYIWVTTEYMGDPFYTQEPCSCHDKNMEE